MAALWLLCLPLLCPPAYGGHSGHDRNNHWAWLPGTRSVTDYSLTLGTGTKPCAASDSAWRNSNPSTERGISGTFQLNCNWNDAPAFDDNHLFTFGTATGTSITASSATGDAALKLANNTGAKNVYFDIDINGDVTGLASGTGKTVVLIENTSYSTASATPGNDWVDITRTAITGGTNPATITAYDGHDAFLYKNEFTTAPTGAVSARTQIRVTGEILAERGYGLRFSSSLNGNRWPRVLLEGKGFIRVGDKDAADTAGDSAAAAVALTTRGHDRPITFVLDTDNSASSGISVGDYTTAPGTSAGTAHVAGMDGVVLDAQGISSATFTMTSGELYLHNNSKSTDVATGVMVSSKGNTPCAVTGNTNNCSHRTGSRTFSYGQYASTHAGAFAFITSPDSGTETTKVQTFGTNAVAVDVRGLGGVQGVYVKGALVSADATGSTAIQAKNYTTSISGAQNTETIITLAGGGRTCAGTGSSCGQETYIHTKGNNSTGIYVENGFGGHASHHSSSAAAIRAPAPSVAVRDTHINIAPGSKVKVDNTSANPAGYEGIIVAKTYFGGLRLTLESVNSNNLASTEAWLENTGGRGIYVDVPLITAPTSTNPAGVRVRHNPISIALNSSQAWTLETLKTVSQTPAIEVDSKGVGDVSVSITRGIVSNAGAASATAGAPLIRMYGAYGSIVPELEAGSARPTWSLAVSEADINAAMSGSECTSGSNCDRLSQRPIVVVAPDFNVRIEFNNSGIRVANSASDLPVLTFGTLNCSGCVSELLITGFADFGRLTDGPPRTTAKYAISGNPHSAPFPVTTGVFSREKVTVSGGASVWGDVRLHQGDDEFLQAGGTTNGRVDLGAGDDKFTGTGGGLGVSTGTGTAISMGSGDDEVDLSGAIWMHCAGNRAACGAAKAIDFGAGGDMLRIRDTYAEVIWGDVDMGGGDDDATIGGGTILGAVLGGAGADEFEVSGGNVGCQSSFANCGQTAALKLGAGNDMVKIKGGTLHGKVEMDAGDDTVTVEGGTVTVDIALGPATLSSGDADKDTFTMTGGTLNDIAIGGGAGDDTITIGGGTVTGAALAISSGAGTDKVMVTGGQVNSTISVSAGGTEEVVLSGGTLSRASGNILEFGSENDTLKIQGDVSIASGNVAMGGGNDTITMTGGTFLGSSFSMGAGNDKFAMTGGKVTGTLLFLSGGGENEFELSGSAKLECQAGAAASCGAGTKAVDFSGADSETLRIRESAEITGDVDMGRGNNVLEMSGGKITGNVRGDYHETTNTDGTISRGRLSVAGGEIKGSISTGGLEDMVEISGSAVVSGVSLGGAKDTLVIKDSARVTGDINLGAGDDDISLGGTAYVGGSIVFGGGQDTFTTSGNPTVAGGITFGPGNNTYTLAGSVANRIDFQAGNDSFTVLKGATLGDGFELGPGDDDLSLDSGITVKDVSADNDSEDLLVLGSDTYTIKRDGSISLEGVKIAGSASAETLTLQGDGYIAAVDASGSLQPGAVAIDMGGGADTLVIDLRGYQRPPGVDTDDADDPPEFNGLFGGVKLGSGSSSVTIKRGSRYRGGIRSAAGAGAKTTVTVEEGASLGAAGDLAYAFSRDTDFFTSIESLDLDIDGVLAGRVSFGGSPTDTDAGVSFANTLKLTGGESGRLIGARIIVGYRYSIEEVVSDTVTLEFEGDSSGGVIQLGAGSNNVAVKRDFSGEIAVFARRIDRFTQSINRTRTTVTIDEGRELSGSIGAQANFTDPADTGAKGLETLVTITGKGAFSGGVTRASRDGAPNDKPYHLDLIVTGATLVSGGLAHSAGTYSVEINSAEKVTEGGQDRGAVVKGNLEFGQHSGEVVIKGPGCAAGGSCHPARLEGSILTAENDTSQIVRIEDGSEFTGDGIFLGGGDDQVLLKICPASGSATVSGEISLGGATDFGNDILDLSGSCGLAVAGAVSFGGGDDRMSVSGSGTRYSGAKADFGNGNDRLLIAAETLASDADGNAGFEGSVDLGVGDDVMLLNAYLNDADRSVTYPTVPARSIATFSGGEILAGLGDDTIALHSGSTAAGGSELPAKIDLGAAATAKGDLLIVSGSLRLTGQGIYGGLGKQEARLLGEASVSGPINLAVSESAGGDADFLLMSGDSSASGAVSLGHGDNEMAVSGSASFSGSLAAFGDGEDILRVGGTQASPGSSAEFSGSVSLGGGANRMFLNASQDGSGAIVFLSGEASFTGSSVTGGPGLDIIALHREDPLDIPAKFDLGASGDDILILSGALKGTGDSVIGGAGAQDVRILISSSFAGSVSLGAGADSLLLDTDSGIPLRGEVDLGSGEVHDPAQPAQDADTLSMRGSAAVSGKAIFGGGDNAMSVDSSASFSGPSASFGGGSDTLRIGGEPLNSAAFSGSVELGAGRDIMLLNASGDVAGGAVDNLVYHSASAAGVFSGAVIDAGAGADTVALHRASADERQTRIDLGDAEPGAADLLTISGALTLTGDSILGGAHAQDARILGESAFTGSVSLGAGDDSLRVETESTRAMEGGVDLGGGQDALALLGSARVSGPVTLSEALTLSDLAALSDRSALGNDGGGAADRMTVGGSAAFSGELAVFGGGDNVLAVGGQGSAARFGGSAYFGSGADTLLLNAEREDGANTYLEGSAVFTGARIMAGAGADVVILHTESTEAMQTSVDLGDAGQDSPDLLYISGSASLAGQSIAGQAGSQHAYVRGSASFTGSVSFGGGADLLEIDTESETVMEGDVDLGRGAVPGDDALSLSGSTRLAGNVYAGAGADSMSVAERARFTGTLASLGDGDDMVAVGGPGSSAEFGGRALLGAGDDTLLLNTSGDSLGGYVFHESGTGARSLFTGSLIEAGDGDDVVSLSTTSATPMGVSIDLGDAGQGGDFLYLARRAELSGPGQSIRGGEGRHTVEILHQAAFMGGEISLGNEADMVTVNTVSALVMPAALLLAGDDDRDGAPGNDRKDVLRVLGGSKVSGRAEFGEGDDELHIGGRGSQAEFGGRALLGKGDDILLLNAAPESCQPGAPLCLERVSTRLADVWDQSPAPSAIFKGSAIEAGPGDDIVILNLKADDNLDSNDDGNPAKPVSVRLGDAGSSGDFLLIVGCLEDQSGTRCDSGLAGHVVDRDWAKNWPNSDWGSDAPGEKKTVARVTGAEITGGKGSHHVVVGGDSVFEGSSISVGEGDDTVTLGSWSAEAMPAVVDLGDNTVTDSVTEREFGDRLHLGGRSRLTGSDIKAGGVKEAAGRMRMGEGRHSVRIMDEAVFLGERITLGDDGDEVVLDTCHGSGSDLAQCREDNPQGVSPVEMRAAVALWSDANNDGADDDPAADTLAISALSWLGGDASFGGGDDELVIRENGRLSGSALLGPGDDRMDLEGNNEYSGPLIDAGDGYDTILLKTSSSEPMQGRVDLGSNTPSPAANELDLLVIGCRAATQGRSTLNCERASRMSSVLAGDVEGGKGRHRVHVLGKALFQGDSLSLGEDDDELIIDTGNSTPMGGRLDLGSGLDTGSDRMSVYGSAVLAGPALFGGGSDRLTLGGASRFTGTADLGPGNDLMRIDGSAVFTGIAKGAGADGGVEGDAAAGDVFEFDTDRGWHSDENGWTADSPGFIEVRDSRIEGGGGKATYRYMQSFAGDVIIGDTAGNGNSSSFAAYADGVNMRAYGSGTGDDIYIMSAASGSFSFGEMSFLENGAGENTVNVRTDFNGEIRVDGGSDSIVLDGGKRVYRVIESCNLDERMICGGLRKDPGDKGDPAADLATDDKVAVTRRGAGAGVISGSFRAGFGSDSLTLGEGVSLGTAEESATLEKSGGDMALDLKGGWIHGGFEEDDRKAPNQDGTLEARGADGAFIPTMLAIDGSGEGGWHGSGDGGDSDAMRFGDSDDGLLLSYGEYSFRMGLVDMGDGENTVELNIASSAVVELGRDSDSFLVKTGADVPAESDPGYRPVVVTGLARLGGGSDEIRVEGALQGLPYGGVGGDDTRTRKLLAVSGGQILRGDASDAGGNPVFVDAAGNRVPGAAEGSRASCGAAAQRGQPWCAVESRVEIEGAGRIYGDIVTGLATDTIDYRLTGDTLSPTSRDVAPVLTAGGGEANRITLHESYLGIVRLLGDSDILTIESGARVGWVDLEGGGTHQIIDNSGLPDAVDREITLTGLTDDDDYDHARTNLASAPCGGESLAIGEFCESGRGIRISSGASGFGAAFVPFTVRTAGEYLLRSSIELSGQRPYRIYFERETGNDPDFANPVIISGALVSVGGGDDLVEFRNGAYGVGAVQEQRGSGAGGAVKASAVIELGAGDDTLRLGGLVVESLLGAPEASRASLLIRPGATGPEGGAQLDTIHSGSRARNLRIELDGGRTRLVVQASGRYGDGGYEGHSFVETSAGKNTAIEIMGESGGPAQLPILGLISLNGGSDSLRIGRTIPAAKFPEDSGRRPSEDLRLSGGSLAMSIDRGYGWERGLEGGDGAEEVTISQNSAAGLSAGRAWVSGDILLGGGNDTLDIQAGFPVTAINTIDGGEGHDSLKAVLSGSGSAHVVVVSDDGTVRGTAQPVEGRRRSSETVRLMVEGGDPRLGGLAKSVATRGWEEVDFEIVNQSVYVHPSGSALGSFSLTIGEGGSLLRSRGGAVSTLTYEHNSEIQAETINLYDAAKSTPLDFDGVSRVALGDSEYIDSNGVARRGVGAVKLVISPQDERDKGRSVVSGMVEVARNFPVSGEDDDLVRKLRVDDRSGGMLRWAPEIVYYDNPDPNLACAQGAAPGNTHPCASIYIRAVGLNESASEVLTLGPSLLTSLEAASHASKINVAGGIAGLTQDRVNGAEDTAFRGTVTHTNGNVEPKITGASSSLSFSLSTWRMNLETDLLNYQIRQGGAMVVGLNTFYMESDVTAHTQSGAQRAVNSKAYGIGLSSAVYLESGVYASLHLESASINSGLSFTESALGERSSSMGYSIELGRELTELIGEDLPARFRIIPNVQYSQLDVESGGRIGLKASNSALRAGVVVENLIGSDSSPAKAFWTADIISQSMESNADVLSGFSAESPELLAEIGMGGNRKLQNGLDLFGSLAFQQSVAGDADSSVFRLSATARYEW